MPKLTIVGHNAPFLGADGGKVYTAPGESAVLWDKAGHAHSGLKDKY